MKIPFGKLSSSAKKKILYGVPGAFEIPYISKYDEGKSHRAKYE